MLPAPLKHAEHRGGVSRREVDEGTRREFGQEHQELGGEVSASKSIATLQDVWFLVGFWWGKAFCYFRGAKEQGLIFCCLIILSI